MAEPASLGLALAFSAGLLSFLSPCVLPLIPSYLTFVTGVGFDDLTRARRAALVHALLFVCGFTLIFVALGASATVLGRLLQHYRVWITRLGGALVILFGLYLLGIVRVAAFDRERRVHLATFAGAVSAMPEVMEFYRMAGDVDYMLRVVVADMASYDMFYKKLISAVPLKNVTSRFAMEKIKSVTALPVPAA